MNVTAQAGDTLFQASGNLPLDSADAKRALRSRLRQQRKVIPTLTRLKAARLIARSALRCAAVRRAKRAGVYLTMGSELQTTALIKTLQTHGIRVFAPTLLPAGLRFRALGHSPLQPHRLGMMQPRRGIALRASQLDVLILPLLGFDHHGTRLGQGGGYYDRALCRLPHRPYRLGLAYAMQQVENLPRESWDVSLHAVLTERKLHRFKRTLAGEPPCATG